MSTDTDPPLGPDTVLARSDELLEGDIDGETVMMSIEQGTYYGLDPIGSEIWALLDTPRSVAEICATMGERYDVEPLECERDVLVFLRDLVSDGSLRPVQS